MGRLTISIPDDLENALHAAAKAKGLAASQVVAEALRAYLAPAPPAPGPTPPPAPASPTAPPPLVEDFSARTYLLALATQVEQIRAWAWDFNARGGSFPMAHPVPAPIPDPPWSGPDSPP